MIYTLLIILACAVALAIGHWRSRHIYTTSDLMPYAGLIALAVILSVVGLWRIVLWILATAAALGAISLVFAVLGRVWRPIAWRWTLRRWSRADGTALPLIAAMHKDARRKRRHRGWSSD